MAITFPSPTQLKNLAAGVDPTDAVTMAQIGGGISFLRISSSGYTLSNTTALQKMFNSTANGAITLASGVYLFDWFFLITGMSATSGNAAVNILGAGTANVTTNFARSVGVDSTSINNAVALNGWFNNNVSGGSLPNIAIAGTGTAAGVSISGMIDVGTAGAGTIIPSIALTTAVATAQIAGNSMFQIERIADTNALSGGSVS